MIILEQKMIQRIQQLGHNFVVIKNLLCSSSCDFIDIQSRKISIFFLAPNLQQIYSQTACSMQLLQVCGQYCGLQ